MDNKRIAAGSQPFRFAVPSIAPGAVSQIDVWGVAPSLRTWLPLDYCEVVNNTNCLLTVFVNSLADSVTIPSNMIKTINRPFRRLTIKNEDIALNADAVVLHMKRLPKEAMKTVPQ